MRVLSFGEVLWDVYPEKKVIGGAPLNFAGCFSALGGEASLLSAVGNDPLGAETVEAVSCMGVDTSLISSVNQSTGVCNVSVDAFGSPTYSLAENTAYDHILINPFCAGRLLSGYYDALYFGTLAQRSPVSEQALDFVCSSGCFREILFDVNFRGEWYTKEIVEKGLRRCTVLKVSREEAGVFSEIGIYPADSCRCAGDELSSLCRFLSMFYSIPVVIITLDKDGAFVFDAKTDEITFSSKPSAAVVSTVGGGDCFSASYLYFKMLGDPITDCLEKAGKLSSYVVSRIESVPDFPEELIREVTGAAAVE